MNNTLIIALLVAALALAGTLLLVWERSPGPAIAPSESVELGVSPYAGTVSPVALVEELWQYPSTAPEEEGLLEQRLYSVHLPDTNLSVVLRPITESEYASFQVQAIGYEIIERQMLAAAVVLPTIEEEDVLGFPFDLISFLEQKINEISGFELF